MTKQFEHPKRHAANHEIDRAARRARRPSRRARRAKSTALSAVERTRAHALMSLDVIDRNATKDASTTRFLEQRLKLEDDARAFARDHRGARPRLFTGLCADVPAVRSWMDVEAFERAGAGSRTCTLSSRAADGRAFIKADCEKDESGTFEEACEKVFVRRERVYARAELVASMASASGVERVSEIFGEEAKLRNCGVWFGAAGNVTPLHYDLCHGFLVQVRGVKTFTVYHPDDWRAMAPRKNRPELSRINLDKYLNGDAEEREKYPDFAAVAPVGTFTLNPGDVLYTPPFFWHHVRTHDEEPAISVLVPFDPSPDEPIHVCHLYG